MIQRHIRLKMYLWAQKCRKSMTLHSKYFGEIPFFIAFKNLTQIKQQNEAQIC